MRETDLMTQPGFPAESSPLPAPAFRFALFFASGIYIGAESHISPAAWGPALCALCVLTAAALRFAPCRKVNLTVLAALLLLACGGLKFVIDTPDLPHLPEPLYARKVHVSGVALTLPEEKGGRVTFTLLADSCFDGTGAFPLRTRVAVSVRRMKGDRGICPASYGMDLLLHGSISAPPPERNPGEFSARRYDRSKGIGAVLSVEGMCGVVIRDSSGGSWLYRKCIYPVRGAILRRAGELLPGEEGEFLKDLLLGDRTGITRETEEAFVDAGVAHVLAVSGYRVLIVACILTSALTLLRVPGPLRPFIAAPALLFYMVLALGNPPVVRGTVMVLVYLLGRVAQRRSSSLNSLGVAALLVLGGDSRQLFDAGFQLSFGAVLAILSFIPPLMRSVPPPAAAGFLSRSLHWTLHSVIISLVVSLGTLPVTAACFGRVSLVGLFTNILVVPATGAGMVLGTLALAAGAVSPPIGEAYAALEGILLHWTIRFSGFAASLPFASIDTGQFGLPGAIAWYAGMGLLSAGRDRRRAAKYLAVLLAALNAALLRTPERAFAPSPGILRLSMIDVGQGDAILVEFPGKKTLLIDAGPLTRAGDAGKRTVVPFLKARGIGAIDVLVITHPDADHSGGAASLIESIPVRRVIGSVEGGTTGVYGRCQAAARERGSPLTEIWRGEKIPAPECARLYVLWPPGRRPEAGNPSSPSGTNDGSIVFRLVYGGVSFLFTGDAGRESEAGMIRSYGKFLSSTVLKVAHHGSENGTSQEFLDAVHPAVALISCGLHNRFRHPSPLLLGRLRRAGALILRTDADGAVVLTSDGRTVSHLSWR